MDEQIRSGDQLQAGSAPHLPETADAKPFNLPQRAPLLLASASDRPPPLFWPLCVLSLASLLFALATLLTFRVWLFYGIFQRAPAGGPSIEAVSDIITEQLLWILVPLGLTNLAWIIAIGYYRFRYCFLRPPDEAITAIDRERLSMQRGHR
jgi:hypothetical protein